jgi:hypothetical protein
VAASLSPAAAAATADAPPAWVYGELMELWDARSGDFPRSFFAMYAAISASVGLRPSFFVNFLVAFFVVVVVVAALMGLGSSSAAGFRRFAG